MKIIEDYLGQAIVADDAGREIDLTLNSLDVRDAAQLQAVRGQLPIHAYAEIMRQTWETLPESDRAADAARAEASL